MIAIQGFLALAALAFGAFIFVTKAIVWKKNQYGNTEPTQVRIPQAILAIAVIFATWFVIIPSFGQVPAGHRGVVLRFGAVTGQVLDEGLYFVTPFVQSVELMDLQVHADKSKATSASRDLQDVMAEITVNYRLDANRVAEVYRDLRQDYVNRVMVPAISEAVKASTAQFDAERLIIERQRVKDMIERILAERLAKHGLLVDGISITDFQFSQGFSQAIEQKVTATQQALKAENDLRRIKAEAQQQIETAKAGAEAIRIQAMAINSQGGRDYVQLKAIEKWNGSVPQWMGSGSAVPFVSMKAPGQ